MDNTEILERIGLGSVEDGLELCEEMLYRKFSNMTYPAVVSKQKSTIFKEVVFQLEQEFYKMKWEEGVDFNPTFTRVYPVTKTVVVYLDTPPRE